MIKLTQKQWNETWDGAKAVINGVKYIRYQGSHLVEVTIVNK